jgi:diguanylate cyclase (GGDEF)-like protein/PAS domain S-box-containing protein
VIRGDAVRGGPTLARALAVGVVSVLVAVHLCWPEGAVGQLSYLACTGGAGVVALVAARRLDGPHSRPWRWVGCGLLASALGDAWYSVHVELAPPVPAVSPADLGWLASYAFLIVAMFTVLRQREDGDGADLEGLIDTGMAVVVSCLVLWQLAVQPVLDDATMTLGARLVGAAYPALDAVVLALVLRALLSRWTRSREWLLLAGGVACWLAADLASLFVEWRGLGLRLLDAGWIGGALLIATAARAAVRRAGADRADVAPAAPHPDGPAARVVSVWQLLLTVLPLLVPSVLELLATWRGAAAHPAQALAGTGLLAGLVLARCVHLLRNREEAERQLGSSRRYYRALAENAADAVLVLDRRGRIVNESPHLAALMAMGGESIRGSRSMDAVFADDREVAQRLMDRALASPGAVFESELRVQTPDGKLPWLAVRVVNLIDDPDVQGVVVNFRDVSDRKHAEAELTHLAFHDSLTGLANRGLFHDRVGHALAAREGCAAAIVYLDLDGFKNVNDGFGHEAGDELLQQVAQRLALASRPADTVARLGGDEFAILLERCTDPAAEAAVVAARILRELTVPVALESGLVTLSASIGIATAEPTSTASSLLRDADVAMYQAKATGRGRWVRYEPAMRAAALERLQLEHDLTFALERDELRVVYQPVVDLDTTEIVGFEALLRWEHPSLGLIAPDRFIPIAEETGLIVPMGRWVLDTACRTVAGWRRAHPTFRDLTIAVNVSARQLESSDLVSHVEDALDAAGLPAHALVLEMTESVLVGDPTAAAGWLRQLRRLGLRVAIDDFGTGYSSLSYLRQFTVDILKVDRTFVSTITGEALPPLVRGLIDLGHTLGLELIAEGIEEEAQLHQLRREGCHQGQGYLFAAPVVPEEAEALLLGVFRPRLPRAELPVRVSVPAPGR